MDGDKKKLPKFMAEVERISKLVRREIYSGRLIPGERITENNLIEAHSISRMTARQVLSQLALDNLVVIEPYKGASVALVGIDRICETFNIVAMLEGYAAKLSVRNITDDDINKLSTILEKQKKIKKGDTRSWQNLNVQFHRLINQRSGNAQIIDYLRHTTEFTNYWFLSKAKTNLTVANKAHEKIIEALKERNGNKARKYMEEHILSRVKYLVDDIEQRVPIGMFRGYDQ